MVAIMAQALDARPGMRVLEVGTGSGYHAAVVAELVAPRGGAGAPPGLVVSVERHDDLAAQARANLGHAGVGPDRVEVVVGDGSAGWPARAPYDRAYLTCAAPTLPAPILDQLVEGGQLLAPVGTRVEQELVRATKEGGVVRTEPLGGCVFVPLVGRFGFAPSAPSA
jgi:protein-L-isoaspartate(D-aspartate) O-methyltransferase